MISVEFVEGSRSHLRLVVSLPQAEPAPTRLANAADLLFSAMGGRASTAVTPPAAPVVPARPTTFTSSQAVLRRLQSLRLALDSDRAAFA